MIPFSIVYYYIPIHDITLRLIIGYIILIPIIFGQKKVVDKLKVAIEGRKEDRVFRMVIYTTFGCLDFYSLICRDTQKVFHHICTLRVLAYY